MSKKTPIKNQSSNENSRFSPIALKSPAAGSPQKNLTGPPRVAKDIVADLYNNIQRWNVLHIKGCLLVKQIASSKAEEPKIYSQSLEENINNLYSVVQSFKENNDLFEVLITQTEAFARLPNVLNPVFFSLDAFSIAQLVREISEAYQKEYKVKQFVLENIGHGKNKNEAMFLASYWTHQLNVTDTIVFKMESLLVETGHRPII